MSPNPLSGQGTAAIYELASGDGTPIKVRLAADSELEPTDDWSTSLSCVQTDDDVAVLALFGPMLGDGAWAGFDVAGDQRWVHEFTVPGSYEIGHDVLALTASDADAENAEATFVDPTSGEVTMNLAGESAVDPLPINGDRYVGADGLVALSGEVINPDVSRDSAQAFGDGSRVLAATEDSAAYDTKSGQRLWTSSVPAPSTAVTYDASTETLIWGAGETLYGVAAETGEQVWTHPLDQDLLGGARAGSGIVIVGSPQLDDHFVLDSKTGRPVRLPSGLHVMSAGSGGIVIVENGTPRVVDRGELS